MRICTSSPLHMKIPVLLDFGSMLIQQNVREFTYLPGGGFRFYRFRVRSCKTILSPHFRCQSQVITCPSFLLTVDGRFPQLLSLTSQHRVLTTIRSRHTTCQAFPGLQMPVTTLAVVTCALDQLAIHPRFPFFGSLTLLEWLTEHGKIFYLWDQWLTVTEYNSEAARCKRYLGKICRGKKQ